MVEPTLEERLGLCSAYSFLYGMRRPVELIEKCKALGVTSIGIADRDNLYGLPDILEKAKEAGIRPVIGVCLTIEGKGLIYCFVESKQGYARICELLTIRNRDKKRYDPIMLLCENSAGLRLVSEDEALLISLAGKVKYLYGGITPQSIKAAGLNKRLGIPLAFLDNSAFLEKEDYNVHRVLRAIDLGKTVGTLEDTDCVTKEGFVLSNSSLIERRLMSWPESAEGTREIAQSCTYNELFDGWVFPGYETGVSAGEELYNRVIEGAVERYGELGDSELARIDYELDIIERKGFAPYFLVMDDIVKMASRTCGRGSGAASIVSYSLGITNVDPIAHHLYFERFLNPARSDPPDIDVDFAWDERDELIKKVIERFGSDHCARVANHNFFRSRSALRETAKAYGFGDGEISRIEKQMFHFGDKSDINDPLWTEILSIAKKIEGLPHGLSMHCGGLVITPNPIHFRIPIENSLEGYPLLSWEKEGTEAAGFVKIDLLGNRSLAVIRDTLRNLEEQGICIDPHTWRPIQDKATVEALAVGNSMGVFYIESPAMRLLQKKTGAGDFEHIVIHSSIIRPAANKFINEYIRRLKGGKWEPLHPRLAKILDETYGILCYQEDVSKTAVALAGFDEAEADKLRKVIAKKAGAVKLALYEKQFFEGCKRNEVSEEATKKIWEMMLSFDGYSFCKPHSASYAMVSFQSAYLRVHHPAEFMAGVLSNQGGYYKSHAYISECRRMGLLLEGPDINLSQWRYYGQGRRVVIGLMAVKGFSHSGAETIIKERERGGDFINLNNFLRRVKLDRDDITALCPAGVFDRIANGLPRTIQARELLKAHTRATRKGQEELFLTEIVPIYKAGSTAVMAPVNKKTFNNELWEEFRSLGFLKNVHPLALWKDKVMAARRIKALRIGDFLGKYICLIGWPITQKEVWTKDGLTMSFLTFEDETAMYETVIFPKVYDLYNHLLFDQRPLLVYGKVAEDWGAVSVEVQRIEILE
ncbi:DNA polymerase III subunit alpha [Leadbettera azotonutricia]|uniref:DNA-directed DNA polymerase n=1 Tax=Leadbettera azotonutricia (strain ATCC BAA-888 / DSM 13862 / ZAS-9) TaxID=545695 RepID=F5YDL0_LEAAZ|nr:DNA polymerase III subunit alpha [Leadbettera azotonutricia]AEF83356.1 DNA polymerase III, alpha subunit [Leadbettera azotonutricia ZAS-9]